MPQLRHVPFAIGSTKGYSEKNNSADIINMFVHMESAGSKSNHIIMNTEGMELAYTLEYDILAMYEFRRDIYVATKNAIYVLKDGEDDFIDISTETDIEFTLDSVSISDNGIDIMFVGGEGYAYTVEEETILVMSSQDGWYESSTVAYMDGYFIFNRNDTGQFFISKVYSPELDAIDWATGESAPDDTLAVIVSNRQLWLFGERSTEVWYDSGNADFPFTRVSGAVTDYGLAEQKTLAKIREQILFVSNDFKVYITSGYQVLRISTPAIEKILDKSISGELYAFSFTNNGHWFYALTATNEEDGSMHTFVYDIETTQWHRRMSCDTDKWKIEGTLNRNYTNNLIGFEGKNIHSLSIHNLTENGNPIRREIVSLPFNDTVNLFKLMEVQLDMETAVNINALMILQLSEDGGVTWSNNHEAYTGKTGKNRNRVRWLRLGQHRDCTIKVITTQPIPIRLLGLHVRT